MSKPISQAEARRLRKRVRELEDRERVRHRVYAQDYPGGVFIVKFPCVGPEAKGSFSTAIRLGCALVAKFSGDSLKIFAVPRDK